MVERDTVSKREYIGKEISEGGKLEKGHIHNKQRRKKKLSQNKFQKWEERK